MYFLKGRRERETSGGKIFHLLILPLEAAVTDLGLAKTWRPELYLGCPASVRGPGTWAILCCCFPRRASRDPDWKWDSQDFSQHSVIGCWHGSRWLNPLGSSISHPGLLWQIYLLIWNAASQRDTEMRERARETEREERERCFPSVGSLPTQMQWPVLG